MQVVQHMHRAVEVNLAALAATTDLPYIEATLPILVSAFDESGAFWTDDNADHVGVVMVVFGLIGTKLNPGGLDKHGVQGYRDIFADDGDISSLIRLYP